MLRLRMPLGKVAEPAALDADRNEPLAQPMGAERVRWRWADESRRWRWGLLFVALFLGLHPGWYEGRLWRPQRIVDRISSEPLRRLTGAFVQGTGKIVRHS